MLRFDRKEQNAVKQLSLNKRINLKKKKSFPGVMDPSDGYLLWDAS